MHISVDAGGSAQESEMTPEILARQGINLCICAIVGDHKGMNVFSQRTSLLKILFLVSIGLGASVTAVACSSKTPATPSGGDPDSGGAELPDGSVVVRPDGSTGGGDSGVAEYRATASILATKDGGTVKGTATFVERNGEVTATVEIGGATPDGLRGLHIHAGSGCGATTSDAGVVTPGGGAGGHWNPSDAGHGDPNGSGSHHYGDMGNITIVDGGGKLVFPSKQWKVEGTGPTSVVGHAIVFHQGTDDLASQPTGDAGARPGCGVIERQ
jgi:superoxide dismutase, Cu-Zn family